MTRKRGQRSKEKGKPELQRCKFQLPGKNPKRFFFGVVVVPKKTTSTVVRDDGQVYQLGSGFVWVDKNIPISARAHAGADDEE